MDEKTEIQPEIALEENQQKGFWSKFWDKTKIFGKKTLHVIDVTGLWLADFLGITGPRYGDIDSIYHIRLAEQRERERRQKEVEDAMLPAGYVPTEVPSINTLMTGLLEKDKVEDDVVKKDADNFMGDNETSEPLPVIDNSNSELIGDYEAHSKMNE
ncbi:uncharacterized protein MONOS_7632 [Monocercomonoides exilis]|uniref:uncharacterized protein n=1 Tax=Monocercomonoides exilis TaxID=2049356 RepID=UPI003559DFDA|nr:hypothetical protein MONOS_7632 [Monocercomonoides exilis]|eukprot:MONOS_7632.1-p1 / transcript=MONOS_7632.1 / gene=MONOS_7632 / organism=Monocercomonoides_exilis_PA203 / gene_product=unspecified product / transcript_product=unspecified product / location=Mono_scaffold00266:23191-23764(-) / protein_length=157 / sequence_SO=supercontig / SO=protein_coding / is_pseudo=false